MPRSLPCDPARYFAAASLTSFAVLGWLLVQWLSLGLAENAHLGHGSEVHHHHPYAGPLAVVMALTAACSLLGVFAVRLRPGADSPRAHQGSKAVLAASSGAAGLFVVVESVELHMMGREHDSSAMAFLMGGATLQLLALPLSWALNLRAVALMETCADRLRTAHRIRVRAFAANPSHAPVRVVATVGSGAWYVRGPPAPVDPPVLLISAAPVPV